jgi:hypothetical protein
MKRILLALFVLCFSFENTFAQWSDNPAINTQVTNLTTEQTIPKVAVGPNGNYYVGFFSSESGNYNVRLQRYDFNGNMMWAQNGILISSHPQMSWLTDWDLTVDHQNHAILTWQDIRSSGNNNVVAYRISPDGNFTWGANGIMLSNSSNFDVSPKVTVTAANNAVFAWQSLVDNNPDVIIMQKLNPAGIKQWGEDGITLSSASRYTWPQLMPVGNDDVVMKFFADTGPVNSPTRHILAQRFNASGSPVWIGNTIISNAGGIKAWTQILSMVNDGNDGFFISWHEDRNFTNRDSPYAQYVNAAGQVQFIPNGVLLATDSHMNHFYTYIAKPANDDHVYIFWSKQNADQNQYGIFGQKLTPTGVKLWPDVGKQIIAVTSNYVLPEEAISLTNDMIILYQEPQNILKAMRLNHAGEPAWNPASATLSSVATSKTWLDGASLFNNQMVFAWGDNRNGAYDIYAQNLHSNGSLGVMASNGYISGSVGFTNGINDPQLATISAGGVEVNPDADGIYTIELEPGLYTLHATHPYTTDFTLGNVVVGSGTTTQINIELVVTRTDLIVMSVNQYNAPVVPVEVNITGPEGIYQGTIESDLLIFQHVPYGSYAGSASFEDITIEADTIISADNSYFIFVFVDVSLGDRNASELFQVSPNPVQADGELRFFSPVAAIVNIKIMDTNGSPISEYTNLNLNAGNNFVSLKTLTYGTILKPGLYIMQLQLDRYTIHKKLILK